jgi:hypothetical protein
MLVKMRGGRGKELLLISDGNVNWFRHYGNHYEGSSNN